LQSLTKVYINILGNMNLPMFTKAKFILLKIVKKFTMVMGL